MKLCNVLLSVLKEMMSFTFCILFVTASAQYPGPAGQPGSSAIYKDSSAFTHWATGCTISRGFQDISDPSLGYATSGDSTMATGIAGANGVVSLGDGGTATCTFDVYISDGPGWDFAVFENGFGDEFLELAFVEVSSNGEDFFRFPAHSLTDTSIQKQGFDSLDATLINNLAGKYKALYGTPFNLAELDADPLLDVSKITHVRIADVVGSIDEQYASYDTAGRKINDPWTTPYPTGGFDLDAIGVINFSPLSIDENEIPLARIYPNPVNGNSIVIEYGYHPDKDLLITLCDISGRIILTDLRAGINTLPELSPGIYLLRFINDEINATHKIVISR